MIDHKLHRRQAAQFVHLQKKGMKLIEVVDTPLGFEFEIDPNRVLLLGSVRMLVTEHGYCLRIQVISDRWSPGDDEMELNWDAQMTFSNTKEFVMIVSEFLDMVELMSINEPNMHTAIQHIWDRVKYNTENFTEK